MIEELCSKDHSNTAWLLIDNDANFPRSQRGAGNFRGTCISIRLDDAKAATSPAESKPFFDFAQQNIEARFRSLSTNTYVTRVVHNEKICS